MDKQRVVASACRLAQPGPEAATEFSGKRDDITARCNRALAQREDLERLIGPGNLEMARDNNRNFSRFMESLFFDYDPKVLVETVIWVFTAYRSHGFKTTYWPAHLNIWVMVLEKTLSGPALEEILPFYQWLIVNIPVFAGLTDPHVPREDSAGDKASRSGKKEARP